MDTNFEQSHKRSKFPTRGSILDNLAQALGILLERKEMQRLKSEKSIDPENIQNIIKDIIDQILTQFYGNTPHSYSIKLNKVLHQFLTFYSEFSLTYESCNASQKQLNYLLIKDLFIPLAADLSTIIFKEDISLLSAIKPTENELPLQRLFTWIEKRVCEEKGILKYLTKKYSNDDNYNKGEDTVRKNLYAWLKNDVTPDVESIQRLILYIEPDLKDELDRKHLKNLFLFARLLQYFYLSLKESFDAKHVHMLVEHYYLLSKFYLWSEKIIDPESLREFIYSTYLNHIDPTIVNRDFYWEDYFLFIQNILYSRVNPTKLIKEGMKRNGLLYNVNEDTAFHYMELYLPVNVLNDKDNQDNHAKLHSELAHYVQQRDIQMSETNNPAKWRTNLPLLNSQKEKVNHLKMRLYILLQPSEVKTHQDQEECVEILSLLKDEYRQSEIDPNLNLLEARYYAFAGNPKKALHHCRQCVEHGKNELGQHIKNMITEGLLLAAKCKSKRDYNFFYKEALLADLFFYDRLKVPANTTAFALLEISDTVEHFKSLSVECDRYFEKCFPA